jgi:MGT family glycosyltransferase
VSRVLFLNQPTIGHLNTLLTIALQMKEEGHQVHFLVPGGGGEKSGIKIFETAASVPKIIANHNIPVDTVKPLLSTGLIAALLPFATGQNEVALSMNMFSQGIELYTREILKIMGRVKPDILVADFAFFSAHLAAELAGIPCIVIYHSGLPFNGKGIPPFGSGLPIMGNEVEWDPRYIRREQIVSNQLDARLNSARKKLGLPASPVGILRTPYSKWLNLITSLEAIEAPRDNLTDNSLFIGPCFAKRKNSTKSRFPFDRLRGDKYKVYVSFGTVFNNKPKVFKGIMSALNNPEYQVIVSAGGAYKRLSQSTIPENVLLFQSVPQVDLLPKVDLVIGHGGNNSTNETLAAGKPLIVMPVGGEQGDNASRIEYLKAGLRVNITGFDEDEIAQKVKYIRHHSEFQERLSCLKQAIDRTDGPKTASTCIEWVARNEKPLSRPVDFPLTITKDNLAALLSGINL